MKGKRVFEEGRRKGRSKRERDKKLQREGGPIFFFLVFLFFLADLAALVRVGPRCRRFRAGATSRDNTEYIGNKVEWTFNCSWSTLI